VSRSRTIATSLKARLRCLRSESGIALPVSVTVLFITGALAAAAATSAMTANRQSSRDKFVKRAVAAADAGIEVGKYRLNKFATVLTATNQCVSKNATTGVLYVETVQADGWCRAQTEDLGEGVTYSYRVSGRATATLAGQGIYQRKIVATGLMSGVQRRAATTVSAPSGNPLFFDGIFSDQDLDMSNTAEINGSARSNGNMNLSNSAKICGSATPGPGKKLNGSKNCAGPTTPATEPFVLAAVPVPNPNENWRITAGAPTPDDPRTGTIGWTSAGRQLDLNHDDLTTNGTDYALCNLTIGTQGELIIPNDGTPTRIFIDSPNNCGGAGTGNLTISTSSSDITNQSGDPSMLQIFVAGSKTIPTTVSFRNSHATQLVIYAPNSTVNLENSTDITGAIVGKKISMSNSAKVTWDARAGSIQLSGSQIPLQIYKRQSWTECTTQATGSSPDSGC
jgi:Tfp pilus assembly protein PilX